MGARLLAVARLAQAMGSRTGLDLMHVVALPLPLTMRTVTPRLAPTLTRTMLAIQMRRALVPARCVPRAVTTSPA